MQTRLIYFAFSWGIYGNSAQSTGCSVLIHLLYQCISALLSKTCCLHKQCIVYTVSKFNQERACINHELHFLHLFFPESFGFILCKVTYTTSNSYMVQISANVELAIECDWLRLNTCELSLEIFLKDFSYSLSNTWLNSYKCLISYNYLDKFVCT